LPFWSRELPYPACSAKRLDEAEIYIEINDTDGSAH
jgi:hypothetical protein